MRLAPALKKEVNALPEKLREQRGEFLLESAFKLLITAAVVVLVISIFGAVAQANRLAAMANDLTRTIEIRGEIDGAAVHAELTRLADAAALEGVTATLDKAGRIQFGDSFTVTLHYTGEFGIGGVVSVPLPFHSTVVGRSEKYWK